MTGFDRRGRKALAAFRFVLLAGATGLTGHANAASAAEDGAEVAAAEYADAPADGEVILVTGSRTGTTEFQSSSPISVVSSEVLTANGQPDLRTALGMANPSFIAAQEANGSSSSKPVRAALLRALSGYHTLVLVDGVRRHNTALLNNTTGTTGAPADLSFIPIEAVERIEVLSDGAAAQYGSDAIAGVVNVILKKAYTGGSVYAQAGEYDTEKAHQGGLGGRGFTRILGGRLGFKIGNDGGFINVAAEYRRISDSNNNGPIGTPVSTIPVSHIYAYGPAGSAPDPREFSASRYRQLWEVIPFGYAYSVLANGEFPIAPGVTAYAHGTFGENSLSSAGTYRSENNSAAVVGSIPVVGTDGVTYTPVGTVPAGGYTPVLDTRQEDWQWTVGLKGDNLAGFKWDVNFSDSRNTGDMYVNGINTSYYDAPGHGYRDIYIGRLRSGQQTADLNLTRELDVGWGDQPIQLALGAGYRHESYLEGPGEPDSYSQGPVIQYPSNYVSASLRNSSTYPSTPFMTGFNPVPLGTLPAETGSWSRHSFSGYLDLSQDITSRLRLGIAGRVEKYSDFGTRVAGKFSARYEVADGFALRGTVNNGFRAPSLAEQYTTVVNTAPGLRQISDGTYVSSPTRNFNSVAVTSPYATALGAQKLKPERSFNFSAGFVAKPARNLDISVDAYQINIHDRIALTGTFTSVPTNGAFIPPVTVNGVTNPSTSQVAALLAAAGLDPTFNVQYFANVGNTRSRGVEGKINYRLEAGAAGDFAINISAAYNQQKVVKINPNPIPAFAATGVGLLQLRGKVSLEDSYPSWVVRGGINWTKGVFNIFLLESYYSTTDAINASAAFANNPIYNTRQPGRAITDLVVSITTPTVPATKFSFGANNLFNVGAANQPNTPPYNARYLTNPLPVNTAWGTGGRFIYGRVSVAW